MIRQITVDMLDDLAAGAAFLATGGGGDPYLACLCARLGLIEHGPARLIAPDELEDDAMVLAIGSVGAPTTALELLPSVDEAVRLVDAWIAIMGRRPDALVSFEIGGANSLIPLVAAAAHGLPVVDGDGMGRALPEATMMTYAIHGISPTPAVAVDYTGHAERIDAPDVAAYEPLIRRFALERGGMAMSAEFAMRGSDLKACIVPGTVTLSIRLGQLLRAHQGNAQSLEPALAALFAGSIYGAVELIGGGLVSDVNSRVIDGYDVGEAIIEPPGDSPPSLRVAIRNEYLGVTCDGRIIASVPDLIIMVDDETGWPINAERLRFGQQVKLFRIGSPAHYLTPAGLASLAPLIRTVAASVQAQQGPRRHTSQAITSKA